MLYSDAALFRVRRWFENLDRRGDVMRSIAQQAGISESTLARVINEGRYPNFQTLRRLERLVPRDFMPLQLAGVMPLADADAAEPEPAAIS